MTDSQSFLLGADVGSSSCKVVLIDHTGREHASGQKAYDTLYSQPGWAEQDPEEWYRTFCQAVRKSLTVTDIQARQIQAISITGPAHNVVLMGENDQILRPVIHWSDRRSTPQAEWLAEEHGDLIFETTFQTVNPSWTLAQLFWVQQNQPEIWSKVKRIFLQKDYVIYRLTGSWQTDSYDAVGTQIYNVKQRSWSKELCEILDLPLSVLPPIGEATQISGFVSKVAADETGLAAGTPVAIGSGDSVVEALGVGVIETGQCIIKLATSGAVNVVTEEPQPSPLTMTYAHVIPRRWYSISATNSGASSAMWFRKAFAFNDAIGSGFSAMEELASASNPGSEGLIFHPYLQGERAPYWDPRMRGDFVGITVSHQQKHFARAVLEGVAFSLRDCLEMVKIIGLPITDITILGGGARSKLWRQILTDILGQIVRYPEGPATEYGAALLAGVAGGVYSNLYQAAEYCLKAKDLEPEGANIPRYEDLFSLYQRVTENLIPIQHALSEMYDRI